MPKKEVVKAGNTEIDVFDAALMEADAGAVLEKRYRTESILSTVRPRLRKRTQGRLCWHLCGEEQQKRRRILQSSHPDLSRRFVS